MSNDIVLVLRNSFGSIKKIRPPDNEYREISNYVKRKLIVSP